MTSDWQRSRRARQVPPPARVAADARDELLAPTIYHERWWLDAASNGAWEEATVEQGGRLIGRLPYLRLRKTRWHEALIMPPMTHSLGPAIAPATSGTAVGTPRQVAVTASLIAQLPRVAHVWFRMHAGVCSTFAFEAAGFQSGVDYTVRIEAGEIDQLWRAMRDKTRNVIRRAEETHAVEAWSDPSAYLAFYADNLRARGMRNVYEHEACLRLLAASLARKRGTILVARDGAGEPQAAVFVIWDRRVSYYHMSTRRPDSANGATSLLIWAAIRHASAAGRTFDMDGVDQANLLLATGFGGSVRPRLLAWRENPWYGLARSLRAARSKP